MNKLNQMYKVPNTQHLQIHHLHKGNSTEEERNGKQYVTIAHLVSKNGIKLTAKSECSKRDNPNRKRGRDIACNRVIKMYHRLQAIK